MKFIDRWKLRLAMFIMPRWARLAVEEKIKGAIIESAIGIAISSILLETASDVIKENRMKQHKTKKKAG